MPEIRDRKQRTSPLQVHAVKQTPAACRSVLIVAGEPSADRYGARLVRRLNDCCDREELRFFGTGGDGMLGAGVEVLCHIRELASIGPREALRHLLRYYRTYNLLIRTCRERRTSVAVLLDFPDFNLRLAKRLKRLGLKVIYYISPQLWAWRRGRIRTVKKYVDRMLVILPFEEEYYRVRGVNVEFVGHPLLEDFPVQPDRNRFFTEHDLDPDLKTIALLPGSRRREVEYILPTMLEAGCRILRRMPAQFLVSVAPAIEAGQLHRIVREVVGRDSAGTRVRIIREDSRRILANADFGFVKSGTSTLEAALVGTPFLITYKISAPSWFLGTILVRTRHKGLVNLIASEEIVPEYLQSAATPEALARAALEVLETPEKAVAMKERLAGIRNMLGSRRATETAAARVAEYLGGKEC